MEVETHERQMDVLREWARIQVGRSVDAVLEDWLSAAEMRTYRDTWVDDPDDWEQRLAARDALLDEHLTDDQEAFARARYDEEEVVPWPPPTRVARSVVRVLADGLVAADSPTSPQAWAFSDVLEACAWIKVAVQLDELRTPTNDDDGGHRPRRN